MREKEGKEQSKRRERKRKKEEGERMRRYHNANPLFQKGHGITGITLAVKIG